MSKGWSETLITSEIDSTALTGTTVGSILPPAALYTMPANMLKIGAALRVKATGRISNIVTTPGTFTLEIRFGSVIVWTGGAIQLNAVAKTNVAWWIDLLLTCRSIGNSTLATMFGQGAFQSESVVGSPVPGTGGSGSLLLPTVTPVVGTGFDSTVSQAVDMRGTFSLSGNSITTHQFVFTHETSQ